jgi:tetratricopeptide (TPR) repeat protein
VSEAQPGERPREPAQPLLATSVGGRAHVEKMLTVAHAEHLHFDAHAASRALFQLEADIPDFVGREELLAELGAHLGAADAQQPGRGARVALYGPPGVGKSALAIHLAHAAKDAFPDAQLYVNLGAGAGMPLAPAEALAGFLRALGVEGPYPESEHERAAFYRSQLEGRRALVVLDNARDLAQIRALLPGTPSCAVIVTSRRPLGGLEGALTRKVDVLDADVAVELLGEIVDTQRVEDEREAALRIARLCGELPLAVRIAGGRLRNQPHHKLAWLADRLADEHHRLGELKLEDQAVRASLAVSYDELEPAAARLFCLLAELPGPDFSAELAAGASGIDTQETERLLDCLLEAQMLETTGVERYRFHDLIRLFAGEHLDAEPDVDRTAILTRAAAWLLDRAQAADLALGAGDSSHADALAWLEAERQSLVASIEAGHAAGVHDAVLTLTFALTDFFSLRSHWDDWIRTHELALRSTRELHAQRAEAGILNNLAIAYRRQGHWDDAIANYEKALELYRGLGDRAYEGQTLNNLANVYANQGRLEEAIANYEQDLAICRELRDRHGEGQTLNNIALIYDEQGRLEEAIANYEQDLAICRELGDRHGEGRTLNNIAITYRKQGRWDEAIADYEQALEIYRDLGDRHGEGQALANLGTTKRALGDLATGEQQIRKAIELLDSIGAPEADVVRAWLVEHEQPPAH